jgi:hypothetical protein
VNTAGRIIVSACALLIFSSQANAAPRHALLGAVLTAHVRNGLVDYRALKRDERLMRYLEQLAATDPAALPSGRDRLAFWINVYNAQTLKLIADNYPVKSIGELHFGKSLVLATALRKTAWHTHRFIVGGREYSLDAVEHAILRPVFRDFRIHAAIVCAAASCPPLRSEAYEGDTIDRQLDEQMRLFLANPKLNRYDAADNTLHLSKIFSWFEKDFTGGRKTIVEALLPYFPAETAEALKAKGRDTAIRYIPYDWALNGR